MDNTETKYIDCIPTPNATRPDLPAQDSRAIPVTAWLCHECDAVSTETLGEPLYECDNCGTTFSRSNSADGASHRCPDCGKFGRKVADDCCATCEAGEVEEVAAWECPECGEVHETKEAADQCCNQEATNA